MLKELTADEIASGEDPALLWKALWDEFPECQAELLHIAAVRREPAGGAAGRDRSANLIFPEGALDHSISIRIHRPSASTICWCRRRSARSFDACRKEGRCEFWRSAAEPAGRPASSSPVLPEHCTEYVFTDVSPRFTAHAQHKFARYPFVQFRTLDIERDPLEQGFDPHSFDLIIASDVLHATKDLRKTLDHIKQLLGSGGTLAIVELTRPWLFMTLIFGLLKGWWLFDDDVRPEPCISQESWKSLLHDAGFSDIGFVADCPEARAPSIR